MFNVNVNCTIEDIKSILGHLGQDYWHDYGAMERSKDAYSKYPPFGGRGGGTDARGGGGGEKSVLEKQIEYAIYLIQSEGIKVDNIFSSPAPTGTKVAARETTPPQKGEWGIEENAG